MENSLANTNLSPGVIRIIINFAYESEIMVEIDKLLLPLILKKEKRLNLINCCHMKIKLNRID